MNECPQCKQKKAVFVAVEYGKRELSICSSCYRECFDRTPLGNIPKRYREDGYQSESPAA